MDHTRLKDDKIVRKLICGAAFGITLMEIAGAVTYIIDGIMTSRFLGSTALAASGIASTCFTVMAVISGVLAAGSQQLCCEQVGSGKLQKASGTFSMTLLITLLISVAVSIVGIALASPFAAFLGASPQMEELHALTRDYILGFFIGAPGHIFVAVLIPAVQLDGGNKRIAASIAVLSAADVIGDFLNVLVFHGGMFGMGLATSFSYYASALFLLAHFFRKDSIFKISFQKLSFSDLPTLFYIGLPRATKRVGNVIRPLLLNRLIILSGGGVAMAAFTVEQNMRYFFESVGVGIGGAAFLLIGMFLGEKDEHAISQTVSASIRYIVLGIGGLAVAYFLASPLLAGLYLPVDSPSFSWAVMVLRCHAVSLPFLAFNEFYINYAQGLGKIKTTHFVTLLNRLVYIVALSFLLSVWFDTEGIWLAIPASEILLCISILAAAAIRNKGTSRNPLQVRFSSTVDQLEASIHSQEELFEMMEDIKAFCKKHNIDSKKSYYSQLFFEEVLTAIIAHGFHDNKRHTIDIRIFIDGDSIFLRTRDDCKAFSAAQQQEMFTDSFQEQYLGISTVYKLAKNVSYVNTMNMNNFIVEF